MTKKVLERIMNAHTEQYQAIVLECLLDMPREERLKIDGLKLSDTDKAALFKLGFLFSITPKDEEEMKFYSFGGMPIRVL